MKETVIAMTAEATHRPAVEQFIVFRTVPELNHVKNQADAECRKHELTRTQARSDNIAVAGQEASRGEWNRDAPGVLFQRERA